MHGASVCSFTLSLNLAYRGVTVFLFTGVDLAELGVIVCDFTFQTFWNRVLMRVPSPGCHSWRILVFMDFPSLTGRSWKTLVLMSFLSLND